MNKILQTAALVMLAFWTIIMEKMQEWDVYVRCFQTSNLDLHVKLKSQIHFAAETPYQVTVKIDNEDRMLLDSTVTLTCSVHPDPPEGMRLVWRDLLPFIVPQPQTTNEKSTNATLILNIGHPSRARYFCNVEQYETVLASGSVHVNVKGKLSGFVRL